MLGPPAEGPPAKDNPYATRHFTCDPQAHRVTCPQGRPLDHEGRTLKDGVRVERFRGPHRDCPVRARGTSDPQGRQIEVRPHTAVVQARRQRWAEPAIRAPWRTRRTIIEPRLGQSKQHDGFRRWTGRGLAGVKTQGSLLCATLNRRVLSGPWRADGRPPAADPMALAIGWANEPKMAGQGFVQVQRGGEKVSGLALARSASRPNCLPRTFAQMQ